MNFTPIGTILSSRLNDLIIYAQFLSAFAGAIYAANRINEKFENMLITFEQL